MNNILEVNHISKNYLKFSLKDFSFSVGEGRIVGFIGRNGAGKTTTLKGIMNLIHLDSGDIFFMGNNMKTHELENKQMIGFELSELNYYPNKTIKQVVQVTSRFYKDFSFEKFTKLCKLFGLDETKKLQELSSGMKVKFSLSIALSHNAKLLILDEPTSGLDPISRDEILDLFKTLVKTQGVSILFSTHITSDLDKCANDILYIQNGEKVFEGTKADFINSYKIVEGPLSSLDSLKEKLVSYKDDDKSFKGLIDANALPKSFKSKDIKVKEPDLEEIMIYLERSKDHEDFVL